mmetsp:Transcript_53704/g.123528  ORF Transcript_53704/g.123528 Transcript_53704/m.123528 type:complete len:319 (-) Transcript_53704:1215-2171(-)
MLNSKMRWGTLVLKSPAVPRRSLSRTLTERLQHGTSPAFCSNQREMCSAELMMACSIDRFWIVWTQSAIATWRSLGGPPLLPPKPWSVPSSSSAEEKKKKGPSSPPLFAIRAASSAKLSLQKHGIPARGPAPVCRGACAKSHCRQSSRPSLQWLRTQSTIQLGEKRAREEVRCSGECASLKSSSRSRSSPLLPCSCAHLASSQLTLSSRPAVSAFTRAHLAVHAFHGWPRAMAHSKSRCQPAPPSPALSPSCIRSRMRTPYEDSGCDHHKCACSSSQLPNTRRPHFTDSSRNTWGHETIPSRNSSAGGAISPCRCSRE